MKILFISDFYPPYIKGGAEISTSLLANWLIERGNSVSVICSTITKKGWIEKGISVYPIFHKVAPESKTLLGALSYAFAIVCVPPISAIRIVSQIRKIKPDCINIVPSSYIFIPLILAIRLCTNIPIVIDCRDYSIICPAHLSPVRPRSNNINDALQSHHGYYCFRGYNPENKFLSLFAAPFALYESMVFNFYKSFLRYLVNHGNQIYLVGVSKYVANQLVLNKFSKAGVRQIYNISPAVATSSSAELLKIPTIAFAGRIETAKGIWDILMAAKILHESISEKFLIKIAGAGEESSQLIQYLQENPMPYVQLLGKCTPDEVIQLYSESVAIIAPSLWPEPFGRFILESIAVGKPVIAYRTGGIPEGIKEGVTGFIVTPGDIESLADAMKYLIQNPQKSREMRNDIINEAIHYSADTIGEARLSLYRELSK